MEAEKVIAHTRTWVEKLVIGYNLCPFAKQPYVQDRIRFVVCEADAWQGLLNALVAELELMQNTPVSELETTLLIHPRTLNDFFQYNDFLARADEVLEKLSLEGIIQIASFHPDYQFAESTPDDPANYTNRSPYPMLHLIRESSIERALANFPDPENIPTRNIATLRELGAPLLKGMLYAIKGTD